MDKAFKKLKNALKATIPDRDVLTHEELCYAPCPQ